MKLNKLCIILRNDIRSIFGVCHVLLRKPSRRYIPKYERNEMNESNEKNEKKKSGNEITIPQTPKIKIPQTSKIKISCII